MTEQQLLELLAALQEGKTSTLEVMALLRQRADRPDQVPDVRIDLDRQRRCGFPEVVYAPGKPIPALLEACERLLAAEQPVLATRCTAEQLEAVLDRWPEAIANPLARTVRIGEVAPQHGRVVVVTAGTADRPVAEEAFETLLWMGVEAELMTDVGVAGPQRLLEQRDRLIGAAAVVVVAGMEGALPSVVGGWVDCPVFGVPTSVGYGASFGGISALLSMLNSCAANVAVVNIDGGFKGAYLAGLVARRRDDEGGKS